MQHWITQCYLPPSRGEIPARRLPQPIKAGTRFSDPGGMQGWVGTDSEHFHPTSSPL